MMPSSDNLYDMVNTIVTQRLRYLRDWKGTVMTANAATGEYMVFSPEFGCKEGQVDTYVRCVMGNINRSRVFPVVGDAVEFRFAGGTAIETPQIVRHSPRLYLTQTNPSASGNLSATKFVVFEFGASALLFDSATQAFTLQIGGNPVAVINSAGITLTGNLTQTGSQTVTGNVDITGDLGLTGNADVTGDVDATGTITGTTDVVGGGKSLKTHVHSGVTAGGANTGAPV